MDYLEVFDKNGYSVYWCFYIELMSVDMNAFFNPSFNPQDEAPMIRRAAKHQAQSSFEQHECVMSSLGRVLSDSIHRLIQTCLHATYHILVVFTLTLAMRQLDLKLIERRVELIPERDQTHDQTNDKKRDCNMIRIKALLML